jgi:glycosyltransferase involved in cell wall biosynthesis
VRIAHLVIGGDVAGGQLAALELARAARLGCDVVDTHVHFSLNVRLGRHDAVVVLAGKDIERGGAYERELRSRAATLGVDDRVVFAGCRDDVAGLLAAADVFVLPSHLEGLPLTVLEAMAAARPVVASSVGGAPAAVADGETGVLDGILADPEPARRLDEGGRRRLEERFSAVAMTERVLALYGR